MIGVGTTIFLVNPQTFGTPFTNEKSLLFDGVNEYVDCGVVSALNATQNLSISCWVKINSSTAEQFIGTFTGAGNAIWIRHDVAGNSWRGSVQNGSASYSDFGSTINTSQWYHVVMVYDGTQGTATDRVKIYVDGSSLTRTGGSGTLPTITLTATKGFDLGGLSDGSVFSNCNIDEVSIFDYSLDATQVSDIYNSGTPTDLDNTSGVTAPVHWWRMGDGDTHPTITDVGTTGGNDGTMTNMESGDITTDVP